MNVYLCIRRSWLCLGCVLAVSWLYLGDRLPRQEILNESSRDDVGRVFVAPAFRRRFWLDLDTPKKTPAGRRRHKTSRRDFLEAPVGGLHHARSGEHANDADCREHQEHGMNSLRIDHDAYERRAHGGSDP